MYSKIKEVRLNLLVVICCTLISCYVSATETAIPAARETGNCAQFSPITFGILPFISAEQLVTRFSPLANYMSEKLNTPVRIETAPNFVEFAKRTHEDQRYDILFTAPHFYPQAHSKAGYKLLVSVDSPGMCALIVAPKNSSIRTIDDLSGKRLATVPPMSLATLLAKKYLSAKGIDPDVDLTMIATPTHDASLLSSYHGVTDASVLMQPPYEASSQQVRDSMRIIAKTESTPHIPISVSPRIDESCASEISEVLLEMNSTKKGKEVLKHNQFAGFKKAKIEEYEKVRDLLVR